VPSDTQTIKALLSLEALLVEGEQPPRVVAEIFAAKNVELAHRAYPAEAEIIASDGVVSRLLAQNIRHPGLSHVYDEILTHLEGNEVYIREAGELVGTAVDELDRRFPSAVLMGLVRPTEGGFRPLLNPPAGTRVEHGDRLVVLGGSYEECEPAGAPVREKFSRGPRAGRNSSDAKLERRILIVGWNHRVPALIAEFGTYGEERYEVRIASKVPISEREPLLRRSASGLSPVSITHLEIDSTDSDQMRSLHPESADSIVFMGADWTDSADESDARTLMGSLIVDELFRELDPHPNVVMELLDPDNATLVARSRGELIVSPLVLSHLMTQVALRPELQSVFDELITVGGAEITFRPLSTYLDGSNVTFDDVERAAAEVGETALGVRTRSTGQVELNPPKRTSWDALEDRDLVTLV
jgi:hypothetical protein